MARPDTEKRAAILAALAGYDEQTYPGDRALAKELGVSHHLVYFVRTGHRRGEASEGEGTAEYDPPVMASGASIPWQWGAGGLVVALVLVAALVVMARQRQGEGHDLPPGAPDGSLVFAS